jgi:chemotaxis protein MotB
LLSLAMAAFDENDPTIVTTPEKRSRFGCVAWLLLLGLFALAVGAAFVHFVFWPLRTQTAELAAKNQAAEARAEDLDQKLTESRAAHGLLQSEHERVTTERQRAIDEKERALKELEALKGELSSNLEAEVQAGDIGIKRRGRELVLDVADKVLFDSGKVEINERGRAVLGHVAVALAKLGDRIVQVGGHTDNTPVVSKDVREHFPTNWELSAARATHVVRHLQEAGKIPGDRLVASGFSQYRPVAANSNEAGRRKNRRIEIVLLPREAPP